MDSKRIKILQKNPNALFKQWLREFIEDAVKKKKKISKTYQKALDSLERYPLTLYSGHDCAILEGFGPKICELLEEKLQKYFANNFDDHELRNLCYKDKIACIRKREREELQELIKDIEAANLIDESTMIANLRRTLSTIEEHNDKNDGEVEEITMSEIVPENDKKSEKEKINFQIIDEENSNSSDDSLDRLLKKYDPKAGEERKKKKKLEKRKPLTTVDSPVSTPKFMKFKSLNSIQHLAGPSYASSPISKFLDVETSGSRKQLNLVEEEDEFDRLVTKYDDNKMNDVLPSPIVPVKRKITKEKALFIQQKITQPLPVVETQHEEKEEEEKFDYISIDDIEPSEFEIILLIDVGESKISSKDIQAKLREFNVKSDVRKLHVGDFVWIAKNKMNKSKELVLPYIVERKRIDDLSSSIKDGRFHEQKFRLRHCGIDNVIYLIENYMKGGKVQCGLPFTTLLQAASNTQIQNKFTVKFTESSDHSGMYLAIMTSFIENIFRNKKPMKYNLLEFTTFNQASVKQRRLTVRETFIKQLLALKGLSVDIALEITKFYPTPSHLYEKYLTLDKSEGEALLSKLTIGDLKRKIPSTISKIIYHFYMHK
ncbi:hypothetical protein PVAND_014138 [Polypedilum vanderplanki]|uniref:Crossover junction endonuclease MUS81 n=1 Tax=Polypedilum vanderplanki TaxID=319348 RepID=A0A9J6CRF3_POLVA|nr:hypothetical protein PVAND_014138 [Polypedilum vanderplanki]